MTSVNAAESSAPHCADKLEPVDILLQLLGQHNEAHRFFAARAFTVFARSLSDCEQVTSIQRALAVHLVDPDPDVRYECIVALSTLCASGPDKEIASMLMESLRNDPEPDSKREIIKILGKWQWRDALPAIRNFAAMASDKESDPIAILQAAGFEFDSADVSDLLFIQETAILALGNIGDESDAALLTKQGLSPNGEDLSVAVCRALKQLGARGRSGLLKLLSNSNPRTRRQAVLSLGDFSVVESLNALNNLLSDPDETVRAAVIDVLVKHDPNLPLLDLASNDRSPNVRCKIAPYVTDNLLLMKRLLEDVDSSVRCAGLTALACSQKPNEQLIRPIIRLSKDNDATVFSEVPAALLAVAGIESRRQLYKWVRGRVHPAKLRIHAMKTLICYHQRFDDLDNCKCEHAYSQLGSLLLDCDRDVRLCATALLADAANNGNHSAVEILANKLTILLRRLVNEQAQEHEIRPVSTVRRNSKGLTNKSRKELESKKIEHVIPISTLKSILKANEKTHHSRIDEPEWRVDLTKEDLQLLETVESWPKTKHVALVPDMSPDVETALSIMNALNGFHSYDVIRTLVTGQELKDDKLAEAATEALLRCWPLNEPIDSEITYRVFVNCQSLVGRANSKPTTSALELLAVLPESKSEELLLNILKRGSWQQQLTALRILSKRDSCREETITKARKWINDNRVESRHTAIQVLAQYPEYLQPIMDRLGQFGGADAQLITEAISNDDTSFVEQQLCRVLRDGTKQRDWRFAMDALARKLTKKA